MSATVLLVDSTMIKVRFQVFFRVALLFNKAVHMKTDLSGMGVCHQAVLLVDSTNEKCKFSIICLKRVAPA